MKYYRYLILVIIFSIVFISCSSEPMPVSQHGSIQIGGYIPGFTGVDQNGTEIASMISPGEFILYIINDELPSTCLDEQCGDEGSYIKGLGGHLIGGSDGKLAKLFGIKMLSSKPLVFDTSLIVVTNDQGRIRAIYKNAQLKHIRALVRDTKQE